MKIALISLNDLSRGYLPLGIASLAGGFKETVHKVRLYHTAFSTEEKIAKQIDGFSPDVVGISFMTPHAKDAKQISKILKKKGVVIIAGGPHASALPQDVLSESAIDFVVRGEGETTFIELCKAISDEKNVDSVQGIAYRDGSGGINFTPERPLIKDLDLLPRIPWDLLPVERYIKDFMINPSFGFKGMPIMASRGCPYNCIFCQPVHGKFLRYRSVANVIEEMIRLRTQYRLEGFNFCDDTLTLNRNWVLRLCQAIGHRRELRNIIWSCNARVDKVDPQLLGKMALAGCRTIWYGIESGSQDSLNRMKKGTDLGRAAQACQWTKEAGVGLRVNILIGFPWEDRSMIYETIRFTKSLKPDQIQFACVRPWPGTHLYRHARGSGYLKRKGSFDFDYSRQAVMPTEHLSIEELKKIRRGCLYELYLDPHYIFRSIFYNLHSPWQLLGYLQRFKDKFLGDGSISRKKRRRFY